ncbi:protein-methionine-sulfoxide reductase catalytic subunit MsrP [Glaciecola petra]|uniref:Protein-methionine-sulfoxide reductase catalytic subunit MsrP n=1 Tax=Glaciecola petra TaxID=3075602 RepID=A0ABU2ZPH8_9ALTE|nr:protein-methionine-sulfoxide reductase catalytic subunit MsrP [Aestuariibacter sp. P117]MDT0594321.1 protein-methionine-sulfoxide reductase catalytic subunit MsrP [Aestuariibacter sp. P117]
MLIKSKQASQAREQDVTDESIYHNRRSLLKNLGYVGLGSLAPSLGTMAKADWFSSDKEKIFETQKLQYVSSTYNKSPVVSDKTPEDVATSYNNFFEFGTSKSDPKEKAQDFTVDPWSLRIDGLVEEPLTLGYDDLFKLLPLEERIYRFRCVEAWSMVIPWIGFELGKLIALTKPLSKAKYVAFSTLYDPEQMPGQRSRFVGGGVDYPYVEGLRIDEAMHPLALLTVGMYGKTLPPQNGAPIRLMTPWKYGFKSIKSIVHIKLVDKEPPTSWKRLAANEYGFYANVNPEVAHPRWSQARERRIMGKGVFNQERIDTQLFNGYSEVAPLYNDLDLQKNY